MSFNATDITLLNYEEAFLLYVDNELSAEGRQAVETFALLHPHLADELELLMATRMPANEVLFSGKEALSSVTMRQAATEKALLLYIDNELHGAGLHQLETLLQTDENIRLQHALLLAAKADAAEQIVCPDKESLYRRERRVVPFPLWMRMAAAVLLLLGGSLYFLVATKPASAPNPVVINNPAPVSPAQTPAQQPALPVISANNQPPAQNAEQIAKQPVDKRINTTPLPDGGKALVQSQKNNSETSPAIAHKRQPAKAATQRMANRTGIEPLLPTNNAFNKTVATVVVTPATAVAYNLPDTELLPAVNNEDLPPTRRGSVKGFLRKTSRFIQRNTGIGTVSVGNEILVGAVAVKLK